MKPSQTIFLNDDSQVVNLKGKEFTVKELQDELIDAHILKKRLSE
jgi:hypothetical protein